MEGQPQQLAGLATAMCRDNLGRGVFYEDVLPSLLSVLLNWIQMRAEYPPIHRQLVIVATTT